MTPTDAPRYTLTELAGLAGVTPRTVRYYIVQGLLPSVGTAGPGAKYGDAQLARLRLIRRLQAEHLTLAAIRQRLAGLDDAAVVSLADEPAPMPPDSALDYIRRLMHRELQQRPSPFPSPASPSPASPSPQPGPSIQPPTRPAGRRASVPPSFAPPTEPLFQRAQWERITLTPDIELHVRRPLPRTDTKRVDRLIAIARDLFEEDQP
jgi:DNA-binding transcriptional MerR regulator